MEIQNNPLPNNQTESVQNDCEEKDKVTELNNTIEDLRNELRECKNFFGYDSSMSIEEMEKYKNDCEEEERQLKESDEEYKKQCEKTEYLTDLVVKLGQLQYTSNETYSKIRKLGLNEAEISSKRKNFINSFVALKNKISEMHLGQFFELLKRWLKLQEEITLIDIQLKNCEI